MYCFDNEPSDLDRQVLRERVSAIRKANGNRVLTAQFLADEIGLSYSTRDFRYLTDEIEEAGGKLEIRVAYLPLNGTTEDGDGTQYIPENQPLFCHNLFNGTWRVEYTDGQLILTAIVAERKLTEQTRRRA